VTGVQTCALPISANASRALTSESQKEGRTDPSTPLRIKSAPTSDANHLKRAPPEACTSGPSEILSRALELHEDDNQREERERLDEHQTENHRRADCRCCSGIARHAFASRRSDPALPQRAAKGRQ